MGDFFKQADDFNFGSQLFAKFAMEALDPVFAGF